MTPLATDIPQTMAIDPTPSPTDHCYVITARDAVGNESPPSNSFYLNFDLLPVATMAVTQTDYDPPVVSWSHSDTSGKIAGYYAYIGKDTSGFQVNQALMSETSFTDYGFAFDPRSYTIVAVDINGIHSMPRTITLPVVTADLTAESTIDRGIMNRIEYLVENHGSDTLSSVRMKADIGGRTHVSEKFTLAAGETRTVPVIVGGYDTLPDYAPLKTTVAITPNTGEAVNIVRNEEVGVGDRKLYFEIMNEEFLRGGSGLIRFVIENTGYEDIEFLTAVGGNKSPSPEVTCSLVDEDGNVLHVTSYKQSVGEHIVTLSSNKTVARIPPGKTFTSDPVEMIVSENAPVNVFVCVEIANIYSGLGEIEQVVMPGIETRHNVVLKDTSYYGDVTSIAPEVSYGHEDIVICGRAIGRYSETPLAEVLLKLVVSVSGFERKYDVLTDEDGNFTFKFTPHPGEAGIYSVRAVHPDLWDRPVHGQFVINKVAVNPSIFNIDLPRNYPQKLSVRIQTANGTDISNLRIVPSASLPPGVTIDLPEPVLFVKGGGIEVLTMNLWADNEAADEGTFTLNLISDESIDAPWGAIIINTHFSDAMPALYFTPDHIETGVARGDIATENIALKNNGLASLDAVRLTLRNQDGSPAPDWVQLNMPSDMGNIGIGETKKVSISFAPDASIKEGLHSFYLTVDSANYPTTDIGLYASVTQSGVGGVLFKVSDIYTGTFNSKNELIRGLAGAKVSIQNEEVLTIEKSLTTDSFGEAIFQELPVGRYKYRVTANNHQERIGRIWVKPGVVSNQELFLDYNLVSVEWSVNEITLEDKYEIILNTTFETDVPAAVVVAEPAAVTLPEMISGDIYHGEVVFVNHGLIRAEKVEFVLPDNDQNFQFELLKGLPDTIEAKERLIVPYRITCIRSPGLKGEDGSGGGCGTYLKCVKANYSYECPNGELTTGYSSHCYHTSYGDCDDENDSDDWNETIGNAFLDQQGASQSISQKNQKGSNNSGSGPSSTTLGGGGGGKCLPDPPPPPENEYFPVPISAQEWNNKYFAPEFKKTETYKQWQNFWEVLRTKKYQHMSFDELPHVDGMFFSPPSSSRDERKDTELYSIICGIGSSVDTLKREYNDLIMDMKVPTAGGELSIKRTYKNKMWAWNVKEQIVIGEPSGEGEETSCNRCDDTTWGYESCYFVNCSEPDTENPLWISKNGVGYKRISEGIYVNGLKRINRTNDGWHWEDDSGNWKSFNSSGRLSACGTRAGLLMQMIFDAAGADATGIADSNGHQVFWFEHDQDGNLKTVSDEHGRSVVYRYSGGNLSSVLDVLGYETTYEYDADNRIALKIDGAGNERKIAWNESGHVVSVLDQNEEGYFFEYDYDKNRREFFALTRSTQGLFKEVWYDEDGDARKVSINGRVIRKIEKDGRTQIITDENGYVTRKQYDEWDNLIETLYPDGSKILYEYDPVFHKASKIISPSGVATEIVYNDIGLPVKITEASGTSEELVKEYSYDQSGRLTDIRLLADDLSEETRCSMDYDAAGNMIRVSDPMGAETQFDYNGLGQMISVTDPLGGRYSYAYDAKGRIVETTNPLGLKTVYERDAVGNLLKEIGPDGFEQKFEYNARNHLISSTDEQGNTARYNRSFDGKVLSTIDPEGVTVSYEYDDSGRLVKTIDGNGNEIHMEYGEGSVYGCSSCAGGRVGQPMRIEYPTFTKTFTYDAMGRKTSETDAISADEGYYSEVTYNAAGELEMVTDREGNQNYLEYDALGRLVKQTDVLGNTTRFVYDNRDNLLAVEDAKGNRTQFEYNRNNQIIKKISPMGEETVFSYNAGGKLIEKINPKGQMAQYDYDVLGRLTSARYFSVDDTVLPAKAVTFEYDSKGNMVSYNDDVTAGTFTYDELNRKLSETVNYGSFELSNHYTYFGNGMRKSYAGPDGEVYLYQYDSNKQLVSLEIPNQGLLTINEYNWLKPTSISFPGGTRKEMAYDPLLRLESSTDLDPGGNTLMTYDFDYDRMNNITAKISPDNVVQYQYDDLYRLEAVTENEMLGEAYSYDAVGNRLTAKESVSPWNYNGNNELEGYGDVSFIYDDNGNMTEKTVADIKTSFIYNSEDRLVRIENEAGGIIARYYYDPFGRRLWKDAGGKRTYFHYSNDGLVGEYDEHGAVVKTYGYMPGSPWTTAPLFMKVDSRYYYYHNDHLGTPQKITAQNGEVVWSAEYLSFGRANIDKAGVINNLRFAGQYYDSETGLHYNWNRYYDPNIGRYLRADPIGLDAGVNLYTYVQNNPKCNIDPYGLFGPAAQQFVADFAEGFLSPTTPPPTLGGAAGYGARWLSDETGLTDVVVEGIPYMWESYYKTHLNPNWRNDPNDPYYPHKDKPEEYYWTAPPEETTLTDLLQNFSYPNNPCE